MDLERGSALIHPGRQKTFDPVEIPRAIRDAGFSSPEIYFTAKGRLEKEKGWLVLRVPGLRHIFLLEGGARFNELKAASASLDKAIQVSGKLHGSSGDRPPGMTVEKFEASGNDL